MRCRQIYSSNLPLYDGGRSALSGPRSHFLINFFFAPTVSSFVTFPATSHFLLLTLFVPLTGCMFFDSTATDIFVHPDTCRILATVLVSSVMGTLVTNPKIRTQSLTTGCATRVFSTSDSFSLPNIALLTQKPRSGTTMRQGCLHHMTDFHTSYHQVHLTLLRLSTSKHRHHQTYQSKSEDHPGCHHHTCTAAILPNSVTEITGFRHFLRGQAKTAYCWFALFTVLIFGWKHNKSWSTELVNGKVCCKYVHNKVKHHLNPCRSSVL